MQAGEDIEADEYEYAGSDTSNGSSVCEDDDWQEVQELANGSLETILTG